MRDARRAAIAVHTPRILNVLVDRIEERVRGLLREHPIGGAQRIRDDQHRDAFGDFVRQEVEQR